MPLNHHRIIELAIVHIYHLQLGQSLAQASTNPNEVLPQSLLSRWNTEMKDSRPRVQPELVLLAEHLLCDSLHRAIDNGEIMHRHLGKSPLILWWDMHFLEDTIG